MPSEDNQHLIDECQRVEEFSKANAATHFTMAQDAHKLAFRLGWLPVVVGGVLSAIVLADPVSLQSDGGRIVGAVAVGLAGAVSSLLTFLNPDRRQMAHQQAGQRYKTLENEARRAHQLFVREESRDLFVLRATELTRRYDELGELSPQTDDDAYRRAMERVQAGTYDSDRPS